MNTLPAQIDKTLSADDVLNGRARLVTRGRYIVIERTPPGTQLRIQIEQTKRIG